MGMADAGRTTPCTSPQHRQFDFWLGEWEVRDPEGRLVGHNRITALYGGCALREEWRGRSGHRGTSLSAWAERRGLWHQTWVDSSGLVLLLDGGLLDGSMQLEGAAPLPDDPQRVVRHRIRWEPIEADRLRQHWQVARDGEAWQTAFDGRYTRAAPGGRREGR